jgi:hypothetical protein
VILGRVWTSHGAVGQVTWHFDENSLLTAAIAQGQAATAARSRSRTCLIRLQRSVASMPGARPGGHTWDWPGERTGQQESRARQPRQIVARRYRRSRVRRAQTMSRVARLGGGSCALMCASVTASEFRRTSCANSPHPRSSPWSRRANQIHQNRTHGQPLCGLDALAATHSEPDIAYFLEKRVAAVDDLTEKIAHVLASR